MINDMILDVAETSRRRLADIRPETVGDIRSLKEPVIRFSEEMTRDMESLKAFLFPNMYRHYKINRMTSKGKRIVKDLFSLLFSEPNLLPLSWQRRSERMPDMRAKARLTADFVAGLTDASAIELHTRLFDPQVRI